MKKALFIALAIGMMGCENKPYSEWDYFEQCTLNAPKIVKIDGCEYIEYVVYYKNTGVTHKGNCNNPIHIHNGGSHE